MTADDLPTRNEVVSLPRSITAEPYETLGGCTCDLDGPEEFDGHDESCPAAPCSCPEKRCWYGDIHVQHTGACLARF